MNGPTKLRVLGAMLFLSGLALFGFLIFQQNRIESLAFEKPLILEKRSELALLEGESERLPLDVGMNPLRLELIISRSTFSGKAIPPVPLLMELIDAQGKTVAVRKTPFVPYRTQTQSPALKYLHFQKFEPIILREKGDYRVRLQIQGQMSGIKPDENSLRVIANHFPVPRAVALLAIFLMMGAASILILERRVQKKHREQKRE